jgi:hypothetical protein
MPQAVLQSLPDDLRAWLDDETLVDLTKRAIRDLGSSFAPGTSDVPEPPWHRQDSILALLTYCYAVGIYSSEGILDQVGSGQNLPIANDGQWLDTAQLRRFRQTHRSEVEHCLGDVLWSAFRLEGPRHSLEFQSATGDPQGRAAQEIQEPLHHLIEQDVQRRVNWAVELDSMALDC